MQMEQFIFFATIYSIIYSLYVISYILCIFRMFAIKHLMITWFPRNCRSFYEQNKKGLHQKCNSCTWRYFDKSKREHKNMLRKVVLYWQVGITYLSWYSMGVLLIGSTSKVFSVHLPSSWGRFQRFHITISF